MSTQENDRYVKPRGTVRSGYPRARKPHTCMDCNGTIKPGMRYYRWLGRSDAWIGLAELVECSDCCARYGRPVPSA